MNHDDSRITMAPPTMLLPTKVAAHHFLDDNVIYEAFPPDQPSRWTSLPVLQWVESLAAATELADQRGSLVVGDDVALSEPSPPILSISDGVYRCSTPPLLSDSMDDQSCCWDLSYIEFNDPKAMTVTRKIKVLGGNFEAMIALARTSQGVAEMTEAYQMVQTRLSFTFDRILWQCRSTDPSLTGLYVSTHGDSIDNSEMRVLLDSLYEETIQKLKKLVSDYQPKGFNQNDSVAPVIARNTVGYPPIPAKTTNRHQSKQELGKFMTAWLRANFTNPYPDDEGLAQMALHCGTTNQVISNWLINARTRKWRPAIIKACELGRPSDFLLEDSMNLFDGKPIRDIGTRQLHPRKETTRSAMYIETKCVSPKHLNDQYINHLFMKDVQDDFISIHDDGKVVNHVALEEEYVPPDKRFRLH